MRRILVTLVSLVVIGYAGICAYMWWKQDSLIYPGGTMAVLALPDLDTTPLKDFKAVTLDTPDGEHLKAWWHAPQSGQGVVIYLHGNAQTIGVDWRITRFEDITAQGFGLLAIEYRGYGGSTGHPSEAGLIIDAETAYDYARQQAPDAKIAAFGDSLGTGVAIALATQRPVAGLMLDSPYASILRLGQRNYGWLPVAQLSTSPWKSEDRIKSVTAPVLIAHCDADQVVPLSEGKRLFDAANQPKEMIVLPGCGHVRTWTEPVKAAALKDFATWIGGTR